MESFHLLVVQRLYIHMVFQKIKNIDIDYLKEIIDEDNYIKSKSYALKVMERTHKTEKQIFDKLVQKGIW